MEIKIQCSCGSRYKFDVEPVDGRVPTPLSCPNCQASWTEHANALIAQNLGLPAASVAPVAAADAPIAPAPEIRSPAVVSVPATGNVRLRVSSHAAPASAAAPEAALEPTAAPAPRYVPNVPTLNPLVDEYDMRAFGKGLAGAALGALVGGVAVYLLFAYTGVRLKLLALGVGFLAGMGARLLGKDRSKQLGMLGAMLSIGMIVCAQYLVVWKWFHEEDSAEKADPSKSEYELRVEEARKVVAAIPNGTDQEIRLYLAKEQAEEGEKPDPKSVDPDDIKEFKTEDLPPVSKTRRGHHHQGTVREGIV